MDCSFNNNWQTEWDVYTMNKLHEISPNVEKRNSNRWDQIVYLLKNWSFQDDLSF